MCKACFYSDEKMLKCLLPMEDIRDMQETDEFDLSQTRLAKEKYRPLMGELKGWVGRTFVEKSGLGSS